MVPPEYITVPKFVAIQNNKIDGERGKYSGQVKDGKPHGLGRFVTAYGNIREG